MVVEKRTSLHLTCIYFIIYNSFISDVKNVSFAWLVHLSCVFFDKKKVCFFYHNKLNLIQIK